MPRIADSELAANVRSRNRVNSERRRQRLALAGKVQLLTWIPDTLRRELDSVAAARREPVSETAAVAIAAGLTQIPTTPVSAVEREREPLCDACEAAAADKATIRRDTSGDGRPGLRPWPDHEKSPAA